MTTTQPINTTNKEFYQDITFSWFTGQSYIWELLFTKNKGPGQQRVNKKPFVNYILSYECMKNRFSSTF